MKTLQRTLAVLLLPFLLGIVAFNIRLHYRPRFVTMGDSQLNSGLIAQLAHLEEKLHGGAAAEMQLQYPEGFVFLNALYGIAWIDVAENLSPGEDLYKKANREIDWVWDQLSSDEAKKQFVPELEPAYGIFYRGWTNYFLGRKLALLPPGNRDSAETGLFLQNCGDIVEAWEKAGTPFLPSYPHSCWPADMIVGMASVAICEKLSPGIYADEIREWLSQAGTSTDGLGLIPHSCDCETGQPLEAARGSSQSLILHFLLAIDSAYAQKAFQTYKGNFLTYRLGLPGIREYPKGTPGNGDIDSGPVIWGIGGAASIVGRRVMAEFGEPAVSIGLRNSLEAFGLAICSRGKKYYLFGAFPMADAFLAWNNSTEAMEIHRLKTKKMWWGQTQTILLLLLASGAFAAFRLFFRKN